MKNKLKSFIEYLEGKWISHQTTYDLTNRQINIEEFEASILSIKKLKNITSINFGYVAQYKQYNNKKIIYNYIYTENSDPILGKLKKIDQNKLTEYFFILLSNNNLKIKYSYKNIKYTEYIYSINKNLKISVIIIKKSNKYIGICFVSDIKIIQK